MGQYRQTRNIEASVVQYIKEQLVVANWDGVIVEKTFSQIYGIALPSICVRVGDTIHEPVQIGDNSTSRDAQVLIDIFAENDGQRLDIKDFLIEVLKVGMVYNEYTVDGGTFSAITPDGRIRVRNISDTPLDFNTDKSDLDVHDRYRHLLTLEVSTGKVEG